MNEDGRRRNMEVGMIMNESYILPVVPHKAGGGSFQNRKRIGEIDCCEWRMSEQKHWPTD